MYKHFIRQRTYRAFADLGAGRVDEHAERFHEEATLRIDRGGPIRRFEGRSAIASALRDEFLPPGSHAFEVQEVVVDGWPHHTRIAVRWTDSPDGEPERQGMNLIHLRWGQVVREYLFAGAASSA